MADRDERNREMMQRYGTTYDDYVILADHAVAYLCGLPPAYRTGFDLDAVVRAIERGSDPDGVLPMARATIKAYRRDITSTMSPALTPSQNFAHVTTQSPPTLPIPPLAPTDAHGGLRWRVSIPNESAEGARPSTE